MGCECHNCGMLPFACVCVPWCHKHDCPRERCKCIEEEWKPNVAAVAMTAVVLTVIVWCVFYFA